MTSRSYRRVGIACALAAALLLTAPAVSGGLIWDIGIGVGYISVVLLVFLYVYPLRGDGLPHSRLLGLSPHRVLGWVMLGATALHVAILFVRQPLIWRYLVPSAPVYMWCGVAAVLLVAVSVYSGLSARTALRLASSRDAPPQIATVHIGLTALLSVLVAVHIIGSGQAVTGVAKIVSALLLLAAPIIWYSLRRRGAKLRSPRPRLRRTVSLAACVPILLLAVPGARQWVLPPAAAPASIAVYFPHETHLSVNCTTCHHNFVDRTGVASCIDCHRSARRDLPHSSEATFHTFCRDCHVELALAGQKHGPARECSACHVQKPLAGAADVSQLGTAVFGHFLARIAGKGHAGLGIAQVTDHPVEQFGQFPVRQR